MKTMYIIRGVSGSGKTTFAHSICNKVVSADDYFMDGKEYKYDATKIKAAHRYCRGKVQSILETEDDVAVANTFVRKWEFEPYLQLAKEYGYKAVVLIVENYHGSKNVHNVPEEAIERMNNNFETKLV